MNFNEHFSRINTQIVPFNRPIDKNRLIFSHFSIGNKNGLNAVKVYKHLDELHNNKNYISKTYTTHLTQILNIFFIGKLRGF